MFEEKLILIVEDDTLIALDLAVTVEENNGRVIGPLPTVQRTMELLDTHPIAAAILDVQLHDRDVTPLALRLAEADIPFIFHTGTGAPEALAEIRPDVPVIMKPANPRDVVQLLRTEIDRMGG